MQQTKGQGGAQRHTHLMSRWKTHGTVEKHWAKLNTVSRDKPFSLRLEKHRSGVGRGHPGLKNTLCSQSTGQGRVARIPAMKLTEL